MGCREDRHDERFPPCHRGNEVAMYTDDAEVTLGCGLARPGGRSGRCVSRAAEGSVVQSQDVVGVLSGDGASLVVSAAVLPRTPAT